MNQQDLDHTFSALADSTRRGILLQLSDGEKNVSELTKPYKMSQPAVSKHLRVLERAGLIDRRRVGRNQIVRLRPERATEASDWIRQYVRFWKQHFDAVEEYLEQAQRRKQTDGN